MRDKGDKFNTVQRACLHRAKRIYWANQNTTRAETLIEPHLQILSDDDGPG